MGHTVGVVVLSLLLNLPKFWEAELYTKQRYAGVGRGGGRVGRVRARGGGMGAW